MKRKITKLDKLRAASLRLSLAAFRADSSLATHPGEFVFTTIFTNLRSGMAEEEAVKDVVQNNRSYAVAHSTASLPLF